MVELSFLVKDGKDFHVPFLLEKWLFVSLAAFRGCWWLLIWVRTRPKSGLHQLEFGVNKSVLCFTIFIAPSFYNKSHF
jgi:hypothetical protein